MIGRVEEGEGEGATDACGLRPQVRGRAPVQARVSEQAQRLDIVADRAARAVICFHEQAEGRAPAHRLQPQRAGAGKQVDHPRALQLRRPVGMGDHVEQALARAVTGRPRAHATGGDKVAAFMGSGDDAHR